MFTTDKQTLDDLNIFGKATPESVYSIFNHCHTRGGALILEQMFRYPLSDQDTINRRSEIIQEFMSSGTVFPLRNTQLDAIEPYLSNTDERTRLSLEDQGLKKKLTHLVAPDGETSQIYKGIQVIVAMLLQLREFTRESSAQLFNSSETQGIDHILNDPAFHTALNLGKNTRIPYAVMVELDTVFRFRHREKIIQVLGYTYRLDVYIAVAGIARTRGFGFAQALPAHMRLMHFEGLYHPNVKNAVATNVSITPGGNVIFLTGANMAGKSTFMKSLSLSLYLAHMGFPVPAAKMEFSVLDGMYTTINLPDNLGMGASHFYAEVLRVKKIALELRDGKNLFILFDELFRGTNVKDAYEATIAITERFARKLNSFFVISTHIIEAGEILRQQCTNVRFLYLPTSMKGNTPIYTYQLKEGITDDRHGMVIINNEGILDMLKKPLKAIV